MYSFIALLVFSVIEGVPEDQLSRKKQQEESSEQSCQKILAHFKRLLVVFSVIVDVEGAVGLLQQNDAHELVGKGHF
jgi:hypothetical protein